MHFGAINVAISNKFNYSGILINKISIGDVCHAKNDSIISYQ